MNTLCDEAEGVVGDDSEILASCAGTISVTLSFENFHNDHLCKDRLEFVWYLREWRVVGECNPITHCEVGWQRRTKGDRCACDVGDCLINAVRRIRTRGRDQVERIAGGPATRNGAHNNLVGCRRYCADLCTDRCCSEAGWAKVVAETKCGSGRCGCWI